LALKRLACGIRRAAIARARATAGASLFSTRRAAACCFSCAYCCAAVSLTIDSGTSSRRGLRTGTPVPAASGAASANSSAPSASLLDTGMRSSIATPAAP
jgi:hypothetical protein